VRGNYGPHTAGSRLLVHDDAIQPLTAAVITRQLLPEAELAYLSACRTAADRPTTTDEPAHIAAAFAGYPRVIATLWPVSDSATVHVATSSTSTSQATVATISIQPDPPALCTTHPGFSETDGSPSVGGPGASRPFLSRQAFACEARERLPCRRRFRPSTIGAYPRAGESRPALGRSKAATTLSCSAAVKSRNGRSAPSRTHPGAAAGLRLERNSGAPPNTAAPPFARRDRARPPLHRNHLGPARPQPGLLPAHYLIMRPGERRRQIRRDAHEQLAPGCRPDMDGQRAPLPSIRRPLRSAVLACRVLPETATIGRRLCRFSAGLGAEGGVDPACR
jgi:CHAT domain